MTDWKKLTDREVLDAMQLDTPINRVRKVFSGEAARLEQAGMQRRTPDPIEYRRMEFEAAEKLIAALHPTMPITLTDDEAYAAFLILDTVARVELGTAPNTVYLREKLLPAYRDWHAANPFKVHPPLDLSIGFRE